MADPAAALRADLAFCTFCPNPCRSAVESAVPETELPSALALLAVMVIDRHVPLAGDVRAALERTGIARRCRAACPYDLDIAGHIGHLTGAPADA